MSAPCPICGDHDGFHHEDVHAARPLPEGKALPLIEVVPPCRACGEPLDGPGAPGCRYPKHADDTRGLDPEARHR